MTELERLLSQDDCCLVSVASIKKALEQEPCDYEKTVYAAFNQVKKERDIAIERLKELGYELGQKIEPCNKDCENCDRCVDDKCPNDGMPRIINPSVNEPCDDAISREDATAEFIKWKNEVAYAFGWDYLGVRIIQSAIDTIRQLPSVQPSRKGHWIRWREDFELVEREVIQNEPQFTMPTKRLVLQEDYHRPRM